MKTYVVCYKTVKPYVCNKGTKYEISRDSFLLCECGTKANAEQVRAELDANREKIAEFGVNPTEVASLFVDYQEAMY